MSACILILGDQLFPDLGDLPESAPIWMREDWELCTRVRHHQQKITLFLSAMRHYRDDLIQCGRKVHYQELEPEPKESFLDALISHMKAEKMSNLHAFVPADRYFRDELKECATRAGITLHEHDNPAFLTSRETWDTYRKRQKRLLMGDFYVTRRKQMGLLLDEANEPEGGRWSFDEDNRKPMPKRVTVPSVRWPEPSDHVQAVQKLVKQHFSDHPGDADDFQWPVTRRQVLAFLDRFLQERLDDFGPYEDSISRDEPFLWHSMLSPYMNMGLILPGEVVDAVIKAYRERGDVKLQSVEGIVRQIIGWREFIKKVDEEYGDNQRDTQNVLGHDRRLGKAWWEGTTGLPPLDIATQRARRYGWCHHIERLMVIGAPMLMAGVHPREAYCFFMEMFIDSADWVMAPNVYGMSQFSDGGFFATKPYVSGSSYVLKMSDYERGDWCDIWDGLYWGFIDRHREMLTGNARMGQMVRGFDRLKPERREKILTAAENWIDEVTLPPKGD